MQHTQYEQANRLIGADDFWEHLDVKTSVGKPSFISRNKVAKNTHSAVFNLSVSPVSL